MKHQASPDDAGFRKSFERFEVPPAQFDHAAHVRLAYVYLCEGSAERAIESMERSIRAFLNHLGADPTKYHETITRAWILAVDHFMNKSDGCASYDEFVKWNPQLLDSRIMLTHYSAEVLFSPAARTSFVQPDLQSIPPP